MNHGINAADVGQDVSVPVIFGDAASELGFVGFGAGIQSVSMGDTDVALVMGAAGSGETRLLSNIVSYDPEGTSKPALKIPSASTLKGRELTLIHIGDPGELVEVQDSSGTVLFTADGGDSIKVTGNGSQVAVMKAVTTDADGDDTAYQTVEFTILAAAVQTLNATPVSVISAPGAGKAIVDVHAHVMLDHQGVDYDAVAAGDDLAFKYTDGSGAKVTQDIAGSGFGDASADAFRWAQPASTLVPVANAPVVAQILVGEWYSAAGDGILRGKMHYRVITLDLSA